MGDTIPSYPNLPPEQPPHALPYPTGTPKSGRYSLSPICGHQTATYGELGDTIPVDMIAGPKLPLDSIPYPTDVLENPADTAHHQSAATRRSIPVARSTNPSPAPPSHPSTHPASLAESAVAAHRSAASAKTLLLRPNGTPLRRSAESYRTPQPARRPRQSPHRSSNHFDDVPCVFSQSAHSSAQCAAAAVRICRTSLRLPFLGVTASQRIDSRTVPSANRSREVP